jgi:CheY-like chemotaxis protein
MKSHTRTTVAGCLGCAKVLPGSESARSALGNLLTDTPADANPGSFRNASAETADRDGMIAQSGSGEGRETVNPALAPEDECVTGRRGKILLVEDEETLLLAVSRMLAKKGYSVLEAIDGAAAVELLRLHGDNVAAMLLDVSLPGVSSSQVLQEARSRRPEIAVILTSAFSRNEVGTSFGGLPVEHFIRKPYRLATLVELLQRVLSAV